jgi:hypothetical protein
MNQAMRVSECWTHRPRATRESYSIRCAFHPGGPGPIERRVRRAFKDVGSEDRLDSRDCEMKERSILVLIEK